MAFEWYVLQAQPGSEQRVKTFIQESVKQHDMGDQFGDILVPTEEVVEMRSGRKCRSERKLYPGYVLVQMKMNADTWHLIKNTPNTRGFIGGSEPTPISAKDATGVLQIVEEGKGKPKPKVLFEIGEVVRVVDGPFNDFSAVVEEVNYDKSRISVAVQIFGRSTPVELEFEQVEKT